MGAAASAEGNHVPFSAHAGSEKLVTARGRALSSPHSLSDPAGPYLPGGQDGATLCWYLRVLHYRPPAAFPCMSSDKTKFLRQLLYEEKRFVSPERGFKGAAPE